MFWFGRNIESHSDWQNGASWTALSKKRLELSQTPLDDILSLLDAFSKESFDDALPELLKESGFSEEETKKTLSLLPELLKRKNLEKRIKAEFGNEKILDRFIKPLHAAYKVKAVPQGIVLHVTAGNVFLSSIDSLLMGFLTKNLSIVKVSGQNKFFPNYFAEKLKRFDERNILADKFAVLYWKGGDAEVETFIKSKVQTIVAWGGEEMISSYQRDLPKGVKLLDFGPKISFQLVTRAGLKDKDLSVVADRIVGDITPWDQSACASPQNLYLESGVDVERLLEAIDLAFERTSPRGPVDEDEATEILKELYRGYWSELMEGGRVIQGKDHLLHSERSSLLKPSPLHRSLIVKRFGSLEELYEKLEPFSYYVQSCSYLLSSDEKERYLNLLALTGIKRFAPLGTVTWGMEGAPHDGRFVLRELVNMIGDESRVIDYGEQILTLHNATTLKSHFEASAHPEGYIFSSGGTTGDPKFVHFSYEEFDFMSDMLAQNLKEQGVEKGMVVANLFVAGNLWSSFLCVDKALEKIGAVQLPIGGMCSNENILFYLKKFKPQVVLGIPSMLVMYAEFMAKNHEALSIPFVFYAGEALSSNRQEYLASVWGTKFFGSAGYASVDAGVIGYQCSYSGPGEHHVFSHLVKLEIIEDEGVVTSLARDTMPVQNYRTGDRMEWIGPCKCGSSDKRFKLLGRIDNVIQIWSCRMLSNDVEASFQKFGVLTFQIKISESREANVVREKLTLSYEKVASEIDHDLFLLDLYERSRDVRDTISFMDFKKDLILEALNQGQLPRNPRTGKISTVLDQRK